jgi:hypothetical protein
MLSEFEGDKVAAEALARRQSSRYGFYLGVSEMLRDYTADNLHFVLLESIVQLLRYLSCEIIGLMRTTKVAMPVPALVLQPLTGTPM